MAEDISLDLACYGMKAVKNTELRPKAFEGMRFNNTYMTNPICLPSRSAIMVGVHLDLQHQKRELGQNWHRN